MKEAVAFVQDGNPLRHAARLYNVPVETIRRWFNGTVTLDCKPGLATILTKEEEQCLVEYIVEMADRGFGLQSEDIMRTAFTIVERSGRPHPFRNDMAVEGGSKHSGNVTQRFLFAPRKLSPTPELLVLVSLLLMIFFAKLGELYGRLNLITKPMQVYNLDETGVCVVHKPGKVFSAVGRKHVYCIISGEKGRLWFVCLQVVMRYRP